MPRAWQGLSAWYSQSCPLGWVQVSQPRLCWPTLVLKAHSGIRNSCLASLWPHYGEDGAGDNVGVVTLCTLQVHGVAAKPPPEQRQHISFLLAFLLQAKGRLAGPVGWKPEV